MTVMLIPTNISPDVALKELMYERLRELAAEDDCGWLDVARFPDVSMVDLADICRYRDPLQFFDPFGDPARGEYLWHLFNETIGMCFFCSSNNLLIRKAFSSHCDIVTNCSTSKPGIL